MKRILYSQNSLLFLILVLLLCACSDNRYRAEKLYWQAERNVERLIKDKGGKLTEKDYKEIISYYQKVVDKFPLEPLSAKAQFVIANTYISLKQFDKAQEVINSIIHNFSNSPEIATQAYFALGNIFEREGNWQKAEGEYEKIMDMYPLTTLGLNIPIYVLQHYQRIKDKGKEEKAYDKAIRRYKSLIEEYSDTRMVPVIKDYLALVHFEEGKYQEALAIWDSIISDYPNTPQAGLGLLKKAEVYLNRLNDLPKAISSYEEFIKRYPHSSDLSKVEYSLALLYFRNNNLDKAKDLFSSLIDKYSKDKELSLKAYLGLSYCYRKELNTDKVMEIYTKIRKDYPKTKEAVAIPFLIAQYYWQINLDTKAEEAIVDAIREYEKLLKDSNIDESLIREVANFLALS
ncbi:MAG: tetratricopeptide repeat protein, partial [Candidatus Omnitrophica bacterium]|nr:tetratricopeptide repeat protein [Candidatus Omnitrophota bacterium]